MTRTLSWTSAILALPLLGWFALGPLLLSLPIYRDEVEWKLMTSRLFQDGGKLVYIFPECSRGRLLDIPASWYPLEFVNSLIYADMTNQQILRYWSVGIFCGLIAYATWFVRRRMPNANPLAICGGLLVPLSFGVLPFLAVLNRPEQGLMLILLFACTLPLVLGDQRSPLTRWLFALLFVLVSWVALATHIKAVFLLPVLLLSACITLRDWRPAALVIAATGFGAWQTLTLWLKRTDCPQSSFLASVFRNQSVSPYDLGEGPKAFLHVIWGNVRGVKDYWHASGFQQAYQGEWLPTANSPRTIIEILLNTAVPLLMATAAFIVVRSFTRATSHAIRHRHLPDAAACIAMCLLLCLLAIAGFQKGKNFYEAALAIPMLGLAVLLVLPAQVSRTSRIAFGCLTILAVVSQAALAARFYPHLTTWREAEAERPAQQDRIRKLVQHCGVNIDQTTTHLLVDPLAYTVLWPTRQPYFFHYVYGWWATGVDPSHTILDAQISGAVGACHYISREQWASVVADGDLCCAHGPTGHTSIQPSG